MKCPRCGQEHPDNARFCPITGQPIEFEPATTIVPPRVVETITCPNCKQTVKIGAIFCPNCSYRLMPERKSKSRSWLWLALLGAGLVMLVIGLLVIFLPQNPALFAGNDQPAISSPSASQNPSAVDTPQKTLSTSKVAPLTATYTITAIITSSPSKTATLTSTITATSTITPSLTPAVVGAPPCTSIGQIWIRPKDKARMVCVPAGSFVIGQKSCGYAGCEKEVNGGSVNLAAYWIDQSEVTNTQFEQFILATHFMTGAERTGASAVYGVDQPVSGAYWRAPQGAGSSINGKADHPVVQLNYFAAEAYCKWVGSDLPTEAQWEKAARGTEGRIFPWGNDLPDDFLLNAADRNLPAPHSRMDKNDGYRFTSPVGKYPDGDSPYGVHDMAGNAWEWTRSYYIDYPYRANGGREIVGDPSATDLVVLRGGCWYDDYGSVRSTLRYGGQAQRSTDGTGFRCVNP
jgi:formylglycine-generating enzyme required for sulfatase activity